VFAYLAGFVVQAAIAKPVQVVGPGYEGAIISVEARLSSDPRHRLSSADMWTPNDADVRAAEQLLPSYINSPGARLRGTRIRSELARYRRQYWGVNRNGRREILIQFFHEDTAVGQKGIWRREPVTVRGGGDQFFRIVYRAQERRFSGLQVNAPE